MKKLILLVLAVASMAMLASATASANPGWHINQTGNFTVTSNIAGKLETTSGTVIPCASISGSGSFTTTTTGTLNLLFHGCKHELGINCTSAGQPTGTIAVNNLEFHNITVEHGSAPYKPGILITPPANSSTITSPPQSTHVEKHFAAFSCFGIPVTVIGNGVIGTITEPDCGGTSTKATLSFRQSATPGHQTHISYTGTNYDLTSTTAGGNHETAAIEAHANVNFPGNRTLTCT